MLDRTTFAMSSEIGPEAIVCIPTFRRPTGLKKTLESLAAQVGTKNFAVVVVENDGEKLEGKRVADAIFASRSLSGFCVVEHAQGNCSAIKQCSRTPGSI